MGHFRARLSEIVKVTSVALLLGACSKHSVAVPGSSDVVGTVSLPLTASTNGHNYRLTNVSLAISGPTYAYLVSTDAPNEAMLSTSLQTGSYTASLYNYTLQQDDGTGNFAPVRSQLMNYYLPFTIFNGTTTTITFQFQTDAVVVTVGSGQLNAIFQVTEVSPVCVPLGSDCGSGRWCPPFDLTGAAPACVLAGVRGVGESCSGPADCVANASCFNPGSGPVCAALCPGSNVGMPCASGGTCQTAGKTYGVCKQGAGGAGGSNGPGGAAGGGGNGVGGGVGAGGTSGAAGNGGVGGGTNTGGVAGAGGTSGIDTALCDACTVDQCGDDGDGCAHFTDMADRTLCERAYACFVDRNNNCLLEGWDPLPCWCGTNQSTCLTDIPATRANGPCVDAIAAAAKLPMGTAYDAGTIKMRLADLNYPLGRAVNLVTCRGSFCSTECQVP